MEVFPDAQTIKAICAKHRVVSSLRWLVNPQNGLRRTGYGPYFCAPLVKNTAWRRQFLTDQRTSMYRFYIDISRRVTAGQDAAHLARQLTTNPIRHAYLLAKLEKLDKKVFVQRKPLPYLRELVERSRETTLKTRLDRIDALEKLERDIEIKNWHFGYIEYMSERWHRM